MPTTLVVFAYRVRSSREPVLAQRALRPGGALAIWSVGTDATFERMLRKHGFTAATHTIREHNKRGGPPLSLRHNAWLYTPDGFIERHRDHFLHDPAIKPEDKELLDQFVQPIPQL